MIMLLDLLIVGLALDVAVLKAGFGIVAVAVVTTMMFFLASLIFNVYAALAGNPQGAYRGLLSAGAVCRAGCHCEFVLG